MKNSFRTASAPLFVTAALATMTPLGCESEPGPKPSPVDDSAITWESLQIAREKLWAGEELVELNKDGSVTFRHTEDDGSENDALLIDGVVVIQSARTGGVSQFEQDTDGDGTFDRQVEASGSADDGDQLVVITSGAAANGEPTRRETLQQISDTMLEYTVEDMVDGEWLIADSGETTIRQPQAAPPAVELVGCNAAQSNDLLTGTPVAVTDGLACLKRYKADDVHARLTHLLAGHSIEFDCGNGLPGTCADTSLFDTYLGVGATTINIQELHAGECTSPEVVIFHELLHAALSHRHAAGQKFKTHADHATDRVYSCTEICFNAAKATQCECAKCLNTAGSDPRCSALAPCKAYHVVLKFEQVGTFLGCPCAPSDVVDQISFTISPKDDGTFDIKDIVDSPSSFSKSPALPGATIAVLALPEAFDTTSATGTKMGNTISAILKGTVKQGECTFGAPDGSVSPCPSMVLPAGQVSVSFDITKFDATGKQEIPTPEGWTAIVTQ